MWLFGKKDKAKDDRAKVTGIVKLWRHFESVELDEPHLERKLKEFARRLDAEAELCAAILKDAGAKGGIDDVDFLFEALTQLPIPPADSERRPDGDFNWERAEAELGVLARVVNGVRVPIQQAIRQKWQENIQSLEKKVGNLTVLSGGKANPDLERAKTDLEGMRQSERNELLRVDEDFRGYLTGFRRLHDLYRIGLDALAGVKSELGDARVVATLRSEDHRYRTLAYRALRRSNWQPKTVEERLEFLIVPAKYPETEAESSKAMAALIRELTHVPTLLNTVEPRLSEEGLMELQGVLLEHLCSLHSETALDRLAQVIASSLEPPELKAKVVAALPDIGTSRAVEVLIKAMDELDMEVRAAAAKALGEVGMKQLTAHSSQLAAQTPDSPEPATDCLRAAMERLVFALRDGDILVRETAAKALKHYPDAVDRLIAALGTDRNPNAREYAAEALRGFEPNPASTEALIQALSDEDAAVRKAAAEALTAQQQVPETPEAKIRYLCARQNWKEARRMGIAATACLVSLLRDRSEDIRLNAVEALGAIRATDAVRNLCITLADSNQEVRRQAAIALRLINDASALEALRIALAKEGFREVKAEIEATIRKLERK